MLKIIKFFEKLVSKAFKAGKNMFFKNNSNKANKIVVDLSKLNKLKNDKFKKLIHMPNIEAKKEPGFLMLNVKKVFNYLR